MFIRVKTTPNSPRQSVQIVAGVRAGDKVRQRIVRHIGIAMDDDELVRLKHLAEVVKAKLQAQTQPELFTPEATAQQVIAARPRTGPQALKVGPYISHYVDELMRDMDLSTQRTSNFLSEYLGTFLPSRYGTLGEELKAAREGALKRRPYLSSLYLLVAIIVIGIIALVAG